MDDTAQIVPVDPSLRDSADVAIEVGVNATVGLSAAEAAARLARDGPNELRAKPPVPVWRRILAQFQDPLVYLLLVAIVISLVAWLAEGAHGAPVYVIVIAIIVIANAALGFVQESSSENAVAALAVMTAANSTVLRDGVLATVPSSGLVRGDILVLSDGYSVCADARLLIATGLKVQEASLTGESDATVKDPTTLGGQSSITRTDKREPVSTVPQHTHGGEAVALRSTHEAESVQYRNVNRLLFGVCYQWFPRPDRLRGPSSRAVW